MNFDLEQLKTTASIFLSSSKVIEVRTSKNPRLGIQAGWFDNQNDIVESVKLLSGKTIVYLTHNPVNPALMARASNKIKDRSEHTTNDKDIIKREWLYTDYDPDRPAGISSTNDEHEKAIKKAFEVYEFLQAVGISKNSLIIADSGNGGHVLVRVDLPNDNDSLSLIKGVLLVLKTKFEGDGILVDQQVCNASRIGKFYGTLTMKGENTIDRPWRMSKILEHPSEIKPTSKELLQSIVNLIPAEAPIIPQQQYSNSTFDVINFMETYSLDLHRKKTITGGTLYELKNCPFNPEHNHGSASIIQFDSGAIVFKCHHNSCVNNKWSDLKVKLGVTMGSNYNAKGPGNIYKSIERDTPLSTHERDRSVTDTVTDEANSERGSLSRFNPDAPLSERILSWVKTSNSWFATDDLDRDLGINQPKDKDNRRQIMLRLKEQGIVEPHSKINKQYRFINDKLTHIDFKHATTTGSLPIKWPFELERLINFYPGNIAVIAGATNAGKTGLILNIIRMNQDNFPIYYFCSEMGDIELRSRLDEFPGMEINDWKFEAAERSSNFADVIVPDCLNIVDFLELTDDLWEVNKHLTDISHKLGTGVAIVALQKKENVKYGRGAEFSAEKSKIYLSLDKGKITIVKGKSWATKREDPQGLSIRFTISGGCVFNSVDGWFREDGSTVFKPKTDIIIPKTKRLIKEIIDEELPF